MGLPVPTLRSLGLLCLGVALIAAARTLGRPEIAGIGAVLVVVPIVAWLAAFAWRQHPGAFGTIPTQRLDRADEHASDLTPGTTVTITLAPEDAGRDLRPAGRRHRRRASEHGPVSYTWTPPIRGTYRLPPWIATRHDPLHLARVRAELDPGVRLVVGPAPTATQVPGIDDAGVRSGRSGGDQLDTTTRPYLTGDPVRRVHWPVSARQGKLMVRPMLQEADGTRVVLLDRNPMHYQGSRTAVASADGADLASVTDFDAAVSTAAAVLHTLSGATQPGVRGGPARLTAFPPPRKSGSVRGSTPGSMPDDEALATAVPSPPRGADSGTGPLAAPTGSAGHTVLVTGVPGEAAADWPRTLHGPVSVLLHPTQGAARPAAEVTGAWERAGWTWHLVSPGTDGA